MILLKTHIITVYFSCCVTGRTPLRIEAKSVRASSSRRAFALAGVRLFLARSARMVGVYIDGGDERGGGSLVGSIVSEYCADASTFERVFSSLDGRVFRRKPSESQGVFDVFLGDESAFHSARAVVRQLERFRRQF